MKLTVIIRDISPLMFMQEPVTHRAVQIMLTPEQESQLCLKVTGCNNGADITEEISSCFIETTPSANGEGEGESK